MNKNLDKLKDLPRCFTNIWHILKELEVGKLEITLNDGRVFQIEGKNPGPSADIEIINPDFSISVINSDENYRTIPK